MTRRGLVGVATVVLVAGCSLGSGTADDPASSPEPSSGTSAPTAPPREYELYLALGNSLAAGYQPTNPGDRTDREGGYVGEVRSGLAQATPPELVNLGCPGETTATMAEGGRCDYPAGSQLAAAEELLQNLPDAGQDVLVTVQVGANDVQRCVALDGGAPAVDEECVTTGLDAVRQRLPRLLSQVRAAAPRADVVVVDYYNPFVVAALLGREAQAFAARTEQVQDELNRIIAAAAADAGAEVAPLADAFTGAPEGAAATTPVVGPICSLTWMCADPPDVHATDAGYALIADQVLEALSGAG